MIREKKTQSVITYDIPYVDVHNLKFPFQNLKFICLNLVLYFVLWGYQTI